jgi:hypothetical protein
MCGSAGNLRSPLYCWEDSLVFSGRHKPRELAAKQAIVDLTGRCNSIPEGTLCRDAWYLLWIATSAILLARTIVKNRDK